MFHTDGAHIPTGSQTVRIGAVAHTPTVAATPGGKQSSQNRRRKEVFPTPEFPTRITLKRRSGRKGALLP